MRAQFIAIGVFVLLVYTCSRGCSDRETTYIAPTKSPVDELIKDMTYVPTYSIILYDMNTEGSYMIEYKHKYRIIKENADGEMEESITDWMPVDKDFFAMHANDMGMEIASKNAEGKVTKTAAPPGYGAYVGNEKYGQWVERDGGSFWEFYGKFAMMNTLFNMMTYPVHRSYYNDYRDNYWGRGRTYYGPKTSTGSYTYGTNGKAMSSQKNSKSWYTNKSNSSFKNKVNSSVSKSSGQVTRSSSKFNSSSGGYKSRGGGFGK